MACEERWIEISLREHIACRGVQRLCDSQRDGILTAFFQTSPLDFKAREEALCHTLANRFELAAGPLLRESAGKLILQYACERAGNVISASLSQPPFQNCFSNHSPNLQRYYLYQSHSIPSLYINDNDIEADK